MKYPGLAKSAQMYGGIGLTAGNKPTYVLLALACLCRAVVPGLHFENLQVSIITFTFHPTCLTVPVIFQTCSLCTFDRLELSSL